jgi:hypothetical protein
MKLDDGKGVIFDTDSKPLTTANKIQLAQTELARLESLLRQQQTRQAYQRVQVAIDIQKIEVKKLIKQYEKEF